MPPPSSDTAALAPGAVVAGTNHKYVLLAQIHRGPRSDVWLAEQEAEVVAGVDDEEQGAGDEAPPMARPRPRRRRVAVKLAAPRRSQASHNEADVMRRLTRCAEATGPSGFAAPLLDAFDLLPSAPQSSPPPFSSSPPSSSAAVPNNRKTTTFALVTPAYGPSAAAVVRGLAAERGRGLPRRAVRRMARSVLAALAHLHGPGHRLAHLDVKPHNLVAELPPAFDGDQSGSAAQQTPEPQNQPHHHHQLRRERWRLVDFGNASPLVRRGPWPLSSARAPSWAPAPFGWRAERLPEYASPAYEAPEAVLRIEGCPGAPADVWALGCCLFEAATGWPLFRPLLVRGRLAIDEDDGDDGNGNSDGRENDSDTGGDEDEAAAGNGDGGDGDAGRRRWRRRVFSTAAEARLLSAVRATLGGPAPLAVLRRSPVWRDYYDGRGEPLDDEGTGGVPPSRALARRPGSTGLRGRRLEDRLRERLGGPGAWGPGRARAFAAFLRPMLAFDPERRVTAEQMLRHEWLLSSEPEEEQEEEKEEDDRPPRLQIEELVS